MITVCGAGVGGGSDSACGGDYLEALSASQPWWYVVVEMMMRGASGGGTMVVR